MPIQSRSRSRSPLEWHRRESQSIWLILLASVSLVLAAQPSLVAADATDVTAFFETRIRPILVDHCVKCHSSTDKKPKGGLRLETRDAMLKGGHSGPAVIPGDPTGSPLIQALSGSDGYEPMPPAGKLPASVIADFKRWITLGALVPPGDRPRTPSPGADKSATGEASDWWSLKLLLSPPVPRPQRDVRIDSWPRNPIDSFVLSKLDQLKLHPAPESDRRTLIRRLTFDLTGLPPSPGQVAHFVSDAAPDAYERLVERLLASPHYGERQARFWMDLVHFAETHGHDQDRIRPNAWPYRDYLISAFNADTPYARFVHEQIAADALFADQPGLTVALGMIAAGPWDESSLRDIRDDSIDRQIGYYIDRDDMVSTVMSTFVSATVHCARCHNHKFDPITQADYYSLQAVFAGVDKAERSYDLDPRVAADRAKLTGAAARATSAKSPTAAALLAQLTAFPKKSLVFAAASEFAPDGSHKPPGKPRPVHLLRRGDIHQPGALAQPGTLACVPNLPSRFASNEQSEQDRRAALALWITHHDNPLTWRSIVNRVWQSHFDRGLVTTPNDFGRMGALPSHPELLDWLASNFRDSGGSLKSLHRAIVTSAAYRQSSANDPTFATIDSDAQWLWRQRRRRLDAESVHDAILAVAGCLDQTMGGPSIQHFGLKSGVHVTPVVDYTMFDWRTNPGAGRRSVYRFLFRTLPDPFFDTLDAADSSQLTAVRNESSTPLQALALLNNAFVLSQCEKFAGRLEADQGTTSARVRLAFELAYSRPPRPDEVAELVSYADRHGLANLARLIINSNEFLFLE